MRISKIEPAPGFVEFTRAEIEQSIAARFERQVAEHPRRLAVKIKNHALSYGALNRAANRLARAILARLGAGAEPVALLFEHGVAVIVAILAILKAGKIYVPLDPTYPREKISSMLEDSQAGLIVCDGKNFSLSRDLAQHELPVLGVDQLDATLADDNLDFSLPPDTLAYILYTSGSTGQPKGVLHNHRNVLHFIRNYTNDFGVGADDRQSLLFSCAVAGAVKNIFGALLNGATLLPFNLKEEGPDRLPAWLIGEGVTLCQMVPTVFRHFAGHLAGKDMFPALRALYLTGEPLFERDVEAYRAHFAASCVLVNALASTELNTIRQFFIDKETPVAGAIVPVGYAVEDTEVLLLDETGAAVGLGRVGEVTLKSRYLALGYWRKPELTRAAFLPDPAGGEERIYCTGDLGLMRPDGCLEYHGRKDFQVKIRGQRVEVGEIEMALLGHPAIRQAVVLAREDTAGDASIPLSTDKRLIGYVVAAHEPAPATGELREFLRKKLPDYMIPSAFVFLPSLPVTAIGKIDRRALPAPDGARPELESAFVAPCTAVEEVLAEMWAQLLGFKQIGIHDNFFELGGHSLLATQFISRLRDAFAVEVPLSRLLEAPTVAALAAALLEGADERARIEKTALRLLEVARLSEAQAGRILDEKSALDKTGRTQ